MENFNPNAIGVANGNYFALPVQLNDAELVLIQVPWDATVSYNAGTSKGPEAIMDASLQVDLFDPHMPQAWNMKIATCEADPFFAEMNAKARACAENVISELEQGRQESELTDLIEEVNRASEKVNEYVYSKASSFLSENRMAAVVGGEHSVPFGLVKALADKYPSFGVLHIDAHADLRQAYEGFRYSHASIMYNILNEIPQVSRIVQVGIRDYCDDENTLIRKEKRLTTYFDFDIKEQLYSGKNWSEICDAIISSLPDLVYISFDIDGLRPDYCPGTGTPVPGGLDFSEADYLLYRLAVSGKKIIGFDLNEVAPSGDSEWDANVGARILFKMAVYATLSNKKL